MGEYFCLGLGPERATLVVRDQRVVGAEHDGGVLRSLTELAVFGHGCGGEVDGTDVHVCIGVAVIEDHDLGVDVEDCATVLVGVDLDAGLGEGFELALVVVVVVGHDDGNGYASLRAVGKIGDDSGIAHLFVFNEQGVGRGVNEGLQRG